MEIDREVVIKTEDDTSQRIAFPAFLYDKILTTLKHRPVALRHRDDLTRGPFPDKIMFTLEITRAQPMDNALLDDALRDDPLWIHVHAIDIARQQRCLGLQRARCHILQKGQATF